MLVAVVAVGVTALELLGQGGALLFGHDAEVDVDVGHTVERGHRVGHEPDDLGPHRTARDGQRDGHLHVPAVDLDPPDHVQLDDRAVDLGVLDRAQGFEHLSLVWGLAGHGWASREFPLRT